VVPGEYTKPSDVAFNWSISSISESRMIIKLAFFTPIKVSIQEIRDQIKIQFI